MSRDYVGLAKCPRCDKWRAFQTDHLEDYSLECWKCKKHTKLKDKRQGGWRTRTEFIQGNMQDAQLVCNELNERRAPRITRVIENELEKPPHKRRDLAKLTKDIKPSTDFKTYEEV